VPEHTRAGGRDAPENPQELLAEAKRLTSELARLVARINRANLATTIPNGATLTDALARRDALQTLYSLIETAAETASSRIDRYGRSEIRKFAIVDVGALRKQLEEVAKDRRELDTAIQATNWATEIEEDTATTDA
jgi:hypothetical protein